MEAAYRFRNFSVETTTKMDDFEGGETVNDINLLFLSYYTRFQISYYSYGSQTLCSDLFRKFGYGLCEADGRCTRAPGRTNAEFAVDDNKIQFKSLLKVIFSMCSDVKCIMRTMGTINTCLIC